MIAVQALRPFLTLTAATLGSLTFTSLIDCPPSLFLWDWWHHRHRGSTNRVGEFYKDKNVWIIGASSGIGQELACQLARQGCANLILSARSQHKLEQVALQESSSQCQCHCQTLDVLNTQGVEELASRFETTLEKELPKIPIDIVIFNSGAGQLQPSLETSPGAIQRIMDVNALWPMIFTPLLLQHQVFRSRNDSKTKKKSACRPHIVVTNSIAAQLPVPLSAVYAASKAAQAQYFASLAAEQPGLRVDVICPGPVDTDFHQNHHTDDEDKLTSTNDHYDESRQTNESNDTDGTLSTTNDNDKPKPRTKMAVDRCAQLMLSAMARQPITNDSSLHQQVWIAPTPMITVIYLQRLFPGLFQRLTTKFGQKRVQLWRQGKDLYDPSSWK